MDKSFRGNTNHPPRVLSPRRLFTAMGSLGWYLYLLFSLYYLMVLSRFLLIKNPLGLPAEKMASWLSLTERYASFVQFNEVFTVNWLLMVGGLLFFAFFPMWKIRAETRYNLQAFPEHLELSRGSKKRKIEYTQIDTIKMVGSGIFSGFKLVPKKGRSLTISPIVERCEYILEAIVHRRPVLLPKEVYQQYRAKLIIADHKMARLQDLLIGNYRWLSLFVLVVLPIFIIATLFIFQSSDSSINSLGIYLGATFKFVAFFQIINVVSFYAVSNLWIDSRKSSEFAKGIKKKVRNLIQESRIIHVCILLMIALNMGLYLGVYTYDMNRYTLVIAAEDIPALEIKRFDLQVIDTRFCHTCIYKVQEGDKVVFTNVKRTGKALSHVGIVTGLPGQQLTMDEKMAKGLRSPASLEFVVPQNDMVIRYGQSGEEYTLLGSGIINGKIIDIIKPFSFLKSKHK